MSRPTGEIVELVTVALVPVCEPRGDLGVLLVTGGGAPPEMAEMALPQVRLTIADATWQDALVRAVREQAGLCVAFDAHLTTVSSTAGQLLIFGQTSPVGTADVADAAGSSGVRVVRDGEPGVALASELHARVIARWFADRARPAAGTTASEDRRCAITGRRAADGAALSAIDLEGAVRAVHELVSQNADFGADQYACALLAGTLDSLIADQRARWGERGSELLLTFLWQIPRDQLPVDDLFAAAARCARTEATADPSACFAQPGIRRARAWMDKVALAHGLGRVMAPVHVADPVGVVRCLFGFGRFGRLDARLRGDSEVVLTQLDEAQWELVYVALGARKAAALTPAGLDPDELLDGFADVLAGARRLAAR